MESGKPGRGCDALRVRQQTRPSKRLHRIPSPGTVDCFPPDASRPQAFAAACRAQARGPKTADTACGVGPLRSGAAVFALLPEVGLVPR